MKHKLEQVPFTNHIGQVLQVGDEVLAIASGYSHSLHISKGVYVGQTNGKASVSYEKDRYGWWDSAGNYLGWSNYNGHGVVRETRKYTCRSTLPRGRVYRIS